MTGTDYSFVERELRRAGYYTDEERGQTVEKAVSALFAVLDGQELDLRERTVVTELFASLVKGDSTLGNRAGERSVWKQFHLGEVPYGTTIRVKPNAYDTRIGMLHNGLTGIFTTARSGRCFIEYHGRTAGGTGHEHHPSKIEYLLKP